MTELMKRARVCFIGGAVCFAAAYLFAPTFLWLGILVGFAAGYTAYEFRETAQAVPRAIEATRAHAPAAMEKVKEWWRKPKPFLVLPLAFAPVGVASFLLTCYVVSPSHPFLQAAKDGNLSWTVCLIMSSIFGFSLLQTLVQKGEDVKKVIIQRHGRRFSEYELEQGYREVEATYSNVLYYAVAGVWGYVCGVVWLISLPFKAVWELIKLVHSDKRMVCGLDCALGGWVTYEMFVTPNMPFLHFLTLVFVGGVFGSVFGIVHYAVSQYFASRSPSGAQ